VKNLYGNPFHAAATEQCVLSTGGCDVEAPARKGDFNCGNAYQVRDRGTVKKGSRITDSASAPTIDQAAQPTKKKVVANQPKTALAAKSGKSARRRPQSSRVASEEKKLSALRDAAAAQRLFRQALSVPSVFHRAIANSESVPSALVAFPTTRILPSACSAIAAGELMKFVNEVSAQPLVPKVVSILPLLL
jgi:hypothetical protein